jgi:hypothetical protein
MAGATEKHAIHALFIEQVAEVNLPPSGVQ